MRSFTSKYDIRILGGLPVTIKATIDDADPDVGIFSAHVCDYSIIKVGGKPVKKTDWLERRIAARKGEEERIVEAIMEDAY